MDTSILHAILHAQIKKGGGREREGEGGRREKEGREERMKRRLVGCVEA